GFIRHESELYTHPYARPVPGWLNFTMWLEHLGGYRFTTLYAGEQMASECLTFPQFLRACIEVVQDPVVRHVFEAPWDEEHFTGSRGKYVTPRYCQAQPQQDEAAWAAQTAWRLLAEGVGDLAKFVKDGAFVPRPAFEEHPAVATAPRPAPRALAPSDFED